MRRYAMKVKPKIESYACIILPQTSKKRYTDQCYCSCIGKVLTCLLKQQIPLKKSHGKHQLLPREKQNLSKFCISKNIACFLEVFRVMPIMPYFSKCKILHSETDFFFHKRHVNAQE